MTQRICQAALVAAAALYLVVVVFNNVTDYSSNFGFVAHVLMMDTTFPDNTARWRAVTSPIAHHAGYVIIIAWEAVAACLCAAGARRLWRARREKAVAYQAAKSVAITGLTVSLLLWFVGFLTVGGEWFLMWQSRVWNGQDAAFRLFACFALVLLFVAREETEVARG